MDYRQQTGEASSWRRARQVFINNERTGVPSITFSEEDVVSVGGKEFRTPSMAVVSGSFNPTAVIPLVNPQTGESLGTTATHGELYVLLHSLYLQLAQARDAAEAAVQAEIAAQAEALALAAAEAAAAQQTEPSAIGETPVATDPTAAA